MNHRMILMWSLLLALAPMMMAHQSTQEVLSNGDDDRTSANLMNELLRDYNPCAGSPVPAVCLCALEFPHVTFDESLPLKLEESGNRYDLATGQSLMNFVRGIVVTSDPDDAEQSDLIVELYANPPATPNAERDLKATMEQNSHFDGARLVAIMSLPRHLGGTPDRLFGGIWWITDTKTLVIAYRGTQTPFEWHLDGMVNTHREIREGLEVTSGFGVGYQYCRNDVMRMVKEFSPETIFVAGHSLGAAVAAITAVDLQMEMANKEDAATIRAMTFGQPRTFSPATAERINATMEKGDLVLWRVVNQSDPIPQVPSAAVMANDVKFQHTDWVVSYGENPSAKKGRDAAWNHHYYFDGYFDPKQGVVRGPVQP